MVMYRYKQSFGQVYLVEYNVVRETRAGKWIAQGIIPLIPDYTFTEKFVKNCGKKRFAYETKEAALTGFIKRTERHIMLTQGNLDLAKQAVLSAQVMMERNNGG